MLIGGGNIKKEKKEEYNLDASKYLELMKGLEDAETLKETLSVLKKIRTSISCKPYKELLLIKTDVSTIKEGDKHLGVIVSLFTFFISFVINNIKSLITNVIIDILEIFYSNVDKNEIENLAGMIIIILFMLLVTKAGTLVHRSFKRSQRLGELEKILDLIIAEREMWNSVHSQAFAEYQQYLKEKEKRIITKT